jgi:hypothetical protein
LHPNLLKFEVQFTKKHLRDDEGSQWHGVTRGGAGDWPVPGAALTGDGAGRVIDGGRRHVDGAQAGTEDAGGAEGGSGPVARLQAAGQQQGFGAWTVVGQTARVAHRVVVARWKVAARRVVAATVRRPVAVAAVQSLQKCVELRR